MANEKNKRVANATDENWVFIPVRKERVIKVLERAVMLKLDDSVSTIFPAVFKRNKETETHIFFSVPKDFKMNVRFSRYNKETKSYENLDKEYDILYYGVKNKYAEQLNTPLHKEDDVDESTPF